jgi:hypothetical protein
MPRNNQSGFSLISMAIFISILGLFLVASIHSFKMNKTIDYNEKNKILLSKIENALFKYAQKFGRLPCPASYTASYAQDSFGQSECAAAASGVTRIMPNSQEILIGAVPVRSLGLKDTDMFDADDTRITYAVSVSMTVQSTDFSAGAIGVWDEKDASTLRVENSAPYVLVAHGKDRVGGYDRQGRLVRECTEQAAGKAFINCANRDGVFRFMPLSKSAQNSGSGTSDYFDDTVLVGSHLIGVQSLKLSYKDANEDRKKLVIIKQALANFATTAGYLPCPALNNVGRGAQEYAREADCSIATQSGIETVQGRVVGGVALPVKIGTLPARTLGLDDDYMFNSSKVPITYAVTEIQTRGIDLDKGGIEIIDSQGNSRLSTPASALYAVILQGSETRECVDDIPTQENCDLDNVFIDMDFNETPGDEFFNDRITFSVDISPQQNNLSPASSVTLNRIALHSQTTTPPDCPGGWTKEREGYSIVGFRSPHQPDYLKFIHDFSDAASCSPTVNFLPTAVCGYVSSGSNSIECQYTDNGASGEAEIITLNTALSSTVVNARTASEMAPSLGRCSICSKKTNKPFVVHSYSTSVPSCPANASVMWTGYSFASMPGSESNFSVSQDPASLGSCLRRFMPDTPVMSLCSGTEGSPQPNIRMSCRQEFGTFSGYYTNNWISGSPGFDALSTASISRCAVCEPN